MDRKDKRLALRGKKKTIAHAVAVVEHIFQPKTTLELSLLAPVKQPTRCLAWLRILQHNGWLEEELSSL